MSPCPRAGRWFRGCRFEARYDEVPNSRPVKMQESSVEAVRAAFYHRVYVRDVCTRCGATIERNRGND